MRLRGCVPPRRGKIPRLQKNRTDSKGSSLATAALSPSRLEGLPKRTVSTPCQRQKWCTSQSFVTRLQTFSGRSQAVKRAMRLGIGIPSDGRRLFSLARPVFEHAARLALGCGILAPFVRHTKFVLITASAGEAFITCGLALTDAHRMLDSLARPDTIDLKLDNVAGDGSRFATSHWVGAAGAAIPANMWPTSVASTSRCDCCQPGY